MNAFLFMIKFLAARLAFITSMIMGWYLHQHTHHVVLKAVALVIVVENVVRFVINAWLTYKSNYKLDLDFDDLYEGYPSLNRIRKYVMTSAYGETLQFSLFYLIIGSFFDNTDLNFGLVTFLILYMRYNRALIGIYKGTYMLIDVICDFCLVKKYRAAKVLFWPYVAITSDLTLSDPCPICNKKFDNDKITVSSLIVFTDCKHVYHKKCIYNWTWGQTTEPVVITCDRCREFFDVASIYAWLTDAKCCYH